MKIKVKQPKLNLEHSAKVGQAKVLYAGENTHGNLYVWIQCHANGIKIAFAVTKQQPCSSLRACSELTAKKLW